MTTEEQIKVLQGMDKILRNENINLKLRINKAIEYIWSTKYEWGDLEEDNEDFDIDVYKLLDILTGEKNDK